MTLQTDRLAFKSKHIRADFPMSLSMFRSQAQQHLNTILAVRDSLLDAYLLFGGGGDIWKDQCENSIMLVRAMEEVVHEFCRLVDSNASLPEILIPLRYPLVVTLHHINKQLSDLMHQVIQFSATCRIPSTQTARQRQTIEGGLKELLQSCDELDQRVNALFRLADQIRFPTQKLANL
jgi:hypothetical protein